MSEDLEKLVENTEDVLALAETYRKKIEEIRYILTGPVGSRTIRESASKKKPGKKVTELHRKIHDALVLLHDRNRPPYPADYVVMEKMEKIFQTEDR